MKSKTSSLLAVLLFSSLVVGLTPASQAGLNGFYAKAGVGATEAEDVELKSYFGQTIAPNSQITLDPGVRVGLHFGYELLDFLAAEAETGFSVNQLDTVTGANDADGYLSQVPLLINAKLHLPVDYPVSPYAGAGFGFSSTIFTADNLNIGGTVYDGTSADVVFAYQFFAGIDIKVAEHMSVGAEYRYLHTGDAKLEAEDYRYTGTPPLSDEMHLGTSEIHSVSVTFTYRF